MIISEQYFIADPAEDAGSDTTGDGDERVK
jgi:hypothetical protein